eukprot:m.112356 g.112356  ORF g.112356 m.112356 type:complete len:129 (-) comp15323_c1_seq2:4-390(-)
MQARWVRRLHQLSSPGSFNSVRVNLAQAHWLNPSPTEEFRERLKHSMEHWRSDRKSAVWLMVCQAIQVDGQVEETSSLPRKEATKMFSSSAPCVHSSPFTCMHRLPPVCPCFFPLFSLDLLLYIYVVQ